MNGQVEISAKHYTARVAFIIDPYKLIINKGSEDKVKIGDKFIIFSLSDNEVIDPESNESLGKFEIVKGYGSVTHIEKNKATVESNEYGKPRRITRRHTQRPIVPGLLAALALYGQDSPKEEFIEEPGDLLPFDEISVGDYLRPI